VERISSFLGSKLSYLIRVVDADEDHFVEMTTSEPFEMRVRYQLDDDGAATLASIRTRGGGTGFFQLAAPLLGKMVRRSIQKDLQNLKRELEQ
jgi:hypothetical protein